MIDSVMVDLEEGSKCPACLAAGLELSTPDECSCHISPPCHHCVERSLACPECGWRAGDPLDELLAEHTDEPEVSRG